MRAETAMREFVVDQAVVLRGVEIASGLIAATGILWMASVWLTVLFIH